MFLNVINHKPEDNVEHILIDITSIRTAASANISSTPVVMETKTISSHSVTANGVVEVGKKFSMGL